MTVVNATRTPLSGLQPATPRWRTEAGGARRVRLTRIHLEEDVAKNTHFETQSGVDFNRAPSERSR